MFAGVFCALRLNSARQKRLLIIRTKHFVLFYSNIVIIQVHFSSIACKCLS